MPRNKQARGRGRGGGPFPPTSTSSPLSTNDTQPLLNLFPQDQFDTNGFNSRGRGRGRGARGGGSAYPPSSRGRGGGAGGFNQDYNGRSFNPPAGDAGFRGRGRGRGGYRGGKSVSAQQNSQENGGNFKGKENLRVKNAQSVSFDYSKVMATTSSFRGKGSRGTNRNGFQSVKEDQNPEAEMEMEMEEDLETMLAKQLESQNPISATENADSLEARQSFSKQSKGKEQERAFSEHDQEMDADEDIILEPPSNYVHKIKNHLERGYPLSTASEDEGQTEDSSSEEEYGGMGDEEERDIYEDDVPDLPPNSKKKSTPLFSFNSFSSSTTNSPSDIQAQNQSRVPIETFQSPNGESSNSRSTLSSSSEVASIIPTGPSSSAGNRWWGAAGLPSMKKNGMGTATTSGISSSISTPQPTIEAQQAAELDSEVEAQRIERAEAAERAREAERVQADLIQKAGLQPQGVKTGLGSSNQTSGLGSEQKTQGLGAMGSYLKGKKSDYKPPKKGFEVYVPSRKILKPLPPGAARTAQNSFLPAPGAYMNDRLILRVPVAFVKATGEWKSGKFVSFEEESERGVKGEKKEETPKEVELQAQLPDDKVEDFDQDLEEIQDSEDLMRKMQEAYPGLEITMDDDEEEKMEVDHSLDLQGAVASSLKTDLPEDVQVESFQTKRTNLQDEEISEEEEEKILIPSSSSFRMQNSSVDTSTEQASEITIESESQLEKEDELPDSPEFENEVDQDEINEEKETRFALEQARLRRAAIQSQIQEAQEPSETAKEEELSFVLDLQGESPSEIQSRSQAQQNPSNQANSWTLGSTSAVAATPSNDTETPSMLSNPTVKVPSWEAATGSSSSHPRLPRDRSEGSKNRNSVKKARRRARMNKFDGNRNDDDGQILDMEDNERIPREGDSDLDWGSDGPPGQVERLEDQGQSSEDEELQRAIQASLGFDSNQKSNSKSNRPKSTFKKGGRCMGVDEAILRDYMENALDINSDSEEPKDQGAMMSFVKCMDPQRNGRQMDEMDILIQRKMDEEEGWMSVSDKEEEEEVEEEILPNGFNSTLTRQAFQNGTAPGNFIEGAAKEIPSSNSKPINSNSKNNSKPNFKSKGKKNKPQPQGQGSDEEMLFDEDFDSEDSDDSDDSELDRAIKLSERDMLGLDSEGSSDSNSEDSDDDDGFGLGKGVGSNKASKKPKGKNSWTWADEDEEVVGALEAFATSHHDTLVGRDRKARNRLFKAIERGDFQNIDLGDLEFDEDDPAYGVAGAVRGVKGGRAKNFTEDDLFEEELQSQWQKDKAKKAAAKKARQAERETSAQNAFKNTHGKKKSKAVKRAEKISRKAREAGELMLDDDEELNFSFGGLGPSSRKFNQKIGSLPTVEGDYLRQAQSLQEVNEQIKVFLQTPGHSTLVLPAMDKRARAQVHLLANAYDLKSQSKGTGNNRFPNLIKTSRSGYNVDQQKIRKVLSGRSNFKFGSSDNHFSGKGKKEKKTVGATGGGSMAPKNREGAQVGFGAEKIGSENVGHKLLSMMGWNEGNGLGKQRMEGINEPVGAMVKINKGGLGF